MKNQLNFGKKKFKTKAMIPSLIGVDKNGKKAFETFIIYYIVGRCIRTFLRVHNNVINFLSFAKVNVKAWWPYASQNMSRSHKKFMCPQGHLGFCKQCIHCSLCLLEVVENFQKNLQILNIFLQNYEMSFFLYVLI